MMKTKTKTKTLFSLLMTAVLLGSCASGDNETTADGTLTLGVNLPGAGSRVAVNADATYGLATTWLAADKLTVWHDYLYDNNTDLSSKDFAYVSGEGSATGAFKAKGFCNPNQPLYVFNQLATADYYTQTAGTGSMALTLSGYGSQDGTLDNLSKWDALYGVTTADGDGVPGSVTMNHLCHAMRIDVVNPDFTSEVVSSIAFACSSATTSILPSSGTFTLGSDGSLTNGTLSGATSWTVNGVAVSSQAASVYFMTFPFSSISGTLTVTATYGGSTYTGSVDLNGFTATSGLYKKYTISVRKN